MSDQDRLQTLQQVAANSNPLGFVTIQVCDLQWLVEIAESGSRSADSNLPIPEFDLTISEEDADAAEHN
jgi:hypothetical protein